VLYFIKKHNVIMIYKLLCFGSQTEKRIEKNDRKNRDDNGQLQRFKTGFRSRVLPKERARVCTSLLFSHSCSIFFSQRHHAPRAGRVSAPDDRYTHDYSQYLSRLIADVYLKRGELNA